MDTVKRKKILDLEVGQCYLLNGGGFAKVITMHHGDSGFEGRIDNSGESDFNGTWNYTPKGYFCGQEYLETYPRHFKYPFIKTDENGNHITKADKIEEKSIWIL